VPLNHEQLQILEQGMLAVEALLAVAMHLVKASRIATPRFFNSTCTSGKPLTRIVTS
jgi:hypothetical protein